MYVSGKLNAFWTLRKLKLECSIIKKILAVLHSVLLKICKLSWMVSIHQNSNFYGESNRDDNVLKFVYSENTHYTVSKNNQF